MSSEETEEQADDSDDTMGEVIVDVEPDSSESPDDKVYLYRIPVEVTGNTITPAYTPTSGGRSYLSYYSVNESVYITDKASPQFHKDEVNVKVEELTRGEVEASDNLVRDFV